MDVRVGIGHISVRNAEGIVWHEKFTSAECADLADQLERINWPNNVGTPLRRLTDMLWALQNDSDACLITSSTEDRPVNVVTGDNDGVCA